MATFSELIAKAIVFVDDDSITSSLGDFINQGVSEIAGGWPSLLDGIADPVPNTLTPPLPDLFTIGTVTTSTTEGFVAMPANFQRNLQLVALSTGTEVDISHSFIEFTETYPLLDRSGRISEAVEHGGKLYYQGIPTTAETVTLHYYRKPIAMVNDADTPDGIPEHLHIALLVNFASWKSYEFLEDGIEGDTPNTLKYKNAFLEAVRTLELTLPSYRRGLQLR
jgi:hypothetical protein